MEILKVKMVQVCLYCELAESNIVLYDTLVTLKFSPLGFYSVVCVKGRVEKVLQDQDRLMMTNSSVTVVLDDRSIREV